MTFKVSLPFGEQLEFYVEKLLNGISFLFRTDIRWIIYRDIVFDRHEKVIQKYYKKFYSKEVCVLSYIDGQTYKSSVHVVVNHDDLPYDIRCQITNFFNNPELFTGE